jgi:hypothetical protein
MAEMCEQNFDTRVPNWTRSCLKPELGPVAEFMAAGARVVGGVVRICTKKRGWQWVVW